MIKNYKDFSDELNEKIKSDDEFYYELLITVINNPQRYTGIFRVSNARTKLLQNVTQSREIKFGDFMEDVITWYLSQMGYENLDKKIDDDLLADQLCKQENIIYLIEQKIRDDHDSTKKEGQYNNFRKKYLRLKEKYPEFIIEAVMWFIDDSLKKNKKYYLEQANLNFETGINVHIMYGIELFTEIFKRPDVWNEICRHLERNKKERSNEVLTIPDFDTSDEILRALKKLKNEKNNLYKKLISSKPEYLQLRNELFPTGKNLKLITPSL